MAWGSIVGRRLVLPPQTSEKMVADFAHILKAQKVHDQRTCPVGGISREVAWCAADGYFIHYASTTNFGLAFIWVSGATNEVVDKFTAFLAEYFEIPNEDALISAIDTAKTTEESGAALVMAGLGAPLAADARFMERIEAAVRNTDTQIRQAGLWGALHTRWPECQPLIQHIAQADPSDQLRREAQAATEHAAAEHSPH